VRFSLVRKLAILLNGRMHCSAHGLYIIEVLTLRRTPPSHYCRNEPDCRQNKNSLLIELHFKNSDCILWAFQIFGHTLVTGRNVLLMLKTFEAHSKWRNIERHWKRILTALWLLSKYSYSIPHILILFERESKWQATSNPVRMFRVRLEWAEMHLECVLIVAGI